MKHRNLPLLRRRLPLRRWVPYAVLIVGCLVSAAAASYVSATIEARARAEFLRAADETRQQIEVRVSSYIEVIRAAAALLAASNETNHAEFRAFVENLQLPGRYPGIDGIGFAERIRARDVEQVVRAIELDGVRNLNVWPRGDWAEYYPIIFLEPVDMRHAGAIGFDMWSDPVRRAAMARARDSGQPVASGQLNIVQTFEQDRPPSFLLYVPIYRTGAPIETVDDRRRALVGFVFSPFHPADLLQNIGSGAASVGFDVYDGGIADPAARLHRSAAGTGNSPYQREELIHVAGREWLVAVSSLGAAASLLPQPATWALSAGVLLSLMLFLITRVQVNAWEAAACHEAELEASEGALRKSESQLQDVVAREREARSHAQAADRSKDEFLAILSHELRTPLNAVLGWLTMLRTVPLSDERRRHALDVIERNARLQAHLIEDLVDVSRIVTGQMRLELQPMSVPSVVSAVLDSLRPTADERGVQIHAVIAAGVGAIRGDAARVQQIVWNLLANAIKFTPRGGHVFVTLTEEGPSVQLSVGDTGIGITPEFLPHVFERFRQADGSTTRSHSGVGLGLAITHHLVELHGGTIEVHSEGCDRGSLFVVRLPGTTASTGAFASHAERG